MELKGNNRDHRIVSKTIIMIELEMTNVEKIKLRFAIFSKSARHYTLKFHIQITKLSCL